MKKLFQLFRLSYRFFKDVRKEIDYWGKIEPAGYAKALTRLGNDYIALMNGEVTEPFGVVLLWYPADKEGDKT